MGEPLDEILASGDLVDSTDQLVPPGAHVPGPSAMTLTHILVFAAAALVALFALPARARAWALFAASVVAIYWLQPAVTIRRLDFAFPTATLGLVVLAWLLTRAPGQRVTREDGTAYGPLTGEFTVGSVLNDVFLPIVLRP